MEERSATRSKAKKQKAKGDNPTVTKRLGEPLKDGVKKHPIPLKCFLETKKTIRNYVRICIHNYVFLYFCNTVILYIYNNVLIKYV